MCNSNGVRDCRELLDITVVSKNRFLKLKNFALKMHSMFGCTYVCESTFSTMKQVKSKNRNQMADETLDDSLRLTIDKETILPGKPPP